MVTSVSKDSGGSGRTGSRVGTWLAALGRGHPGHQQLSVAEESRMGRAISKSFCISLGSRPPSGDCQCLSQRPASHLQPKVLGARAPAVITIPAKTLPHPVRNRKRAPFQAHVQRGAKNDIIGDWWGAGQSGDSRSTQFCRSVHFYLLALVPPAVFLGISRWTS